MAWDYGEGLLLTKGARQGHSSFLFLVSGCRCLKGVILVERGWFSFPWREVLRLDLRMLPFYLFPLGLGP